MFILFYHYEKLNTLPLALYIYSQDRIFPTTSLMFPDPFRANILQLFLHFQFVSDYTYDI